MFTEYREHAAKFLEILHTQQQQEGRTRRRRRTEDEEEADQDEKTSSHKVGENTQSA